MIVKNKNGKKFSFLLLLYSTFASYSSSKFYHPFLHFCFYRFFSLPFYSLTLLLFFFILFLFLLIILFLCLNLCLTLTNLFSASSRFKFLQSKILSRTYLFVTKDDRYTDRLWIFESCGSLLVTILKNHFHHFHPFLLLPLLLKDIVRPSN